MKTPWYTHPFVVFIFSVLALSASLFLYIRSYLQVNEAFDNFLSNQKLDRAQFLQTETWVYIVILSVLVGIIALGLFLVFTYYSKVIQLYKQQQNFINGFTHELKTPIASLRLFLDAFSRHELSREDQLKYLGYMRRDIDRLTDNVNQILQIAKLEDKSYQKQFETIDLKVFLEGLLNKISHTHQDVELKIECDTEGPWIIPMERTLIEMVVMNLVSNGIHYNHNDRKRLILRLKRTKTEVLLSLEDNGVGLDKRDIKKIFKKFYQVGTSSKGSGLGLYMVAQVMKLHRGKVAANSEGMGKGSTFILSFPLKGEKRGAKSL
jgi:two-component system, OmpR family, phosphate regulon sensor histidine kinase PhoR